MNLNEAARATRKYFVTWHGLSDNPVWQVFEADSGEAVSSKYATGDEAQAARDHLNLEAVLEAIKTIDVKVPWMTSGSMHKVYMDAHVAVIDALIAEVKAE